ATCSTCMLAFVPAAASVIRSKIRLVMSTRSTASSLTSPSSSSSSSSSWPSFR
ncbi:hypothetical protein M9458_024284, partial [Cirrhinus mrigala]